LPPRSRQDLARVLLNRADGDIALVRAVFEDEGILDAIVGFHAQQAGAVLALIEDIRSWAGTIVER